ncbi:hypothetical protein D9758_000208 [Tetrapyrgos nigripes]|uniref:NAD(P)-binding protein n=1 Tax=Tetrapyrgos nigripes TaxID=182062 RepID=A0A8H5H1N4_9AGAR|nr:hypothetical protein D9758_000208 [Tetrapyrgos nigripes]
MKYYSHEDFVREQTTPMAPVVTADLSGKTVIVTGANTGIGLEASKHFARMNPGRLVIVCRNETKGQVAATEIKNETNFDCVELWIMDQGDFSSIKAFADRAEKELSRIDYLVENAAIYNAGKYILTTNGWEQELQVNHLGPTLLSFLLLPKMITTAKTHNTHPRLVSVSSNVHYWASIEKELIDAPNPLEICSSKEYCTPSVMEKRYQSTKLLNLLAVRALHARLPQTFPTITIVAVNPGLCDSPLYRSIPEESKNYWADRMKLAYTSEEGSRQVIYGALGGADTEEEEQSMRGGYISLSELREVSDWILSEDGSRAEDKFWNETVKVLGEVDDRVHKVVSGYLRG